MAGPTPTLIGIPWDVNSSFLRGAAAAPPLVRQALFSPASNMWSELGVDLGEPGRLADAGDLVLPDSTDAIGLIEAAVRLLTRDGGAPLAIGGDHAVTYPVVRAVAARHPGLTLLHIDAHPDLYDEFEGNRLSHACPFARIMEEGLATRLVQVGIRTANGHQREQARRFGVDVKDREPGEPPGDCPHHRIRHRVIAAERDRGAAVRKQQTHRALNDPDGAGRIRERQVAGVGERARRAEIDQ